MKTRRPFAVSVGLGLLALVAGTPIPAAHAANEVVNAEQLRQKLGLLGRNAGSLAQVKVAVLDNGFEGFEPGRGLLPSSAELVPGPQNEAAPTAHGLGMAQILWAVTGQKPEGPKIYLVNANGFTNFKAAIDFVVRERIDLVLYSEVWEFGSNFDGTGFINAEVSRAIDAGALWVNAAGNFGGEVYEGAVQEIQPAGLRFVNRLDDNDVELTLSWNDFAESSEESTWKDLDLLVYSESGKLVGSSELIQRGEKQTAANPKLSSYAREHVVLSGLDRGTYVAKVHVQSRNFGPSDRYRLLVDSEKPGSIELKDHTPGAEIFPPADHPRVLTVGEDSPISSVGPTADGRVKPEIRVADATAQFSNGMSSGGSSTAAALVAGCVAVLKAEKPALTQSELLAYAASLSGSSRVATATAAAGTAATDDDDGLPETLSRASRSVAPASAPTSVPALRLTDPALVPAVIRSLIPPGGRLASDPLNGHFIVLTPGDPYLLPWAAAAGAHRGTPQDTLVLSLADNRWYSAQPSEGAAIRRPLIEFRPLLDGAAAASAGNPSAPGGEAGHWRMPAPGQL